MSLDVSQYPSPDDTLQNESSSPTFYLPDPSETPEPTSDGSNLGNHHFCVGDIDMIVFTVLYPSQS